VTSRTLYEQPYKRHDLEDLVDEDIALGPHLDTKTFVSLNMVFNRNRSLVFTSKCVVLVRCRRLQDLLVLQGTTKSTRKKSHEKRHDVTICQNQKINIFLEGRRKSWESAENSSFKYQVIENNNRWTIRGELLLFLGVPKVLGVWKPPYGRPSLLRKTWHSFLDSLNKRSCLLSGLNLLK